MLVVGVMVVGVVEWLVVFVEVTELVAVVVDEVEADVVAVVVEVLVGEVVTVEVLDVV